MQFTLLTWNILHQDFTERKLQPDRLQEIFAKIKSYNADVVCLQEVDSSEIESIYKPAFDDKYQIMWQNDKGHVKKLKQWLDSKDEKTNLYTIKKPNTITCMTLVKKDKFNVNHATIKSRRLSVSLKIKENTALWWPFGISNVHLEAGKNTNSIYIKHMTTAMGDAIICGDFNDYIGEPVFKYLEKFGYRSVYDITNKTPTFTMHDTENNVKSVLDYIYIKDSHLKVISVKCDTGCNLSDHIPIFAEFEYINKRDP